MSGILLKITGIFLFLYKTINPDNFHKHTMVWIRCCSGHYLDNDKISAIHSDKASYSSDDVEIRGQSEGVEYLISRIPTNLGERTDADSGSEWDERYQAASARIMDKVACILDDIRSRDFYHIVDLNDEISVT
jgi:hypothetical protein